MWKVGFYFSACVTVLAVVESCQRWFGIPFSPFVIGKHFWLTETTIHFILSYAVASRGPTAAAYLQLGLLGFLSALIALCLATHPVLPSAVLVYRAGLVALTAGPPFALAAGLLFWLLSGAEMWET